MASYLSVVAPACLMFVLTFSALLAQDAPIAKTAAPRLSDTEVKALVKQLGTAKETERDVAIKKLRAAGVAVIPAVADAVGRVNKQASENALEILKAHVEGADPEAALAAFGELRGISTQVPKNSAASAAAEIIKEHPELKEKWEAARLALREKRKANAEEKGSPPKTAAQPKPVAPLDPLMQLRKQALEQQLKDGELAIEKIKKLKLPKAQESEQISAIMQGLQKVRENLKDLEGGGRKK